MTTYSKETALYSTDAIANDIDAASKTAENYIELDGDGIKVHKVVDPDNYVRINSDGMEVFKDGNSVADFGDDVRIGGNITEDGEATGSRTEILPGGVVIYSSNDIAAFEVRSSGSQKKVWRKSGSLTKSESLALNNNINSSTRQLGVFDTHSSNASNSEKIKIRISNNLRYRGPTVLDRSETIYLKELVFTKGTSQTLSTTIKMYTSSSSSSTSNVTITVAYDATADTYTLTKGTTSYPISGTYSNLFGLVFHIQQTIDAPQINLIGNVYDNDIKLVYEPGDSITYGEYESGLVITGFVTSSKTEDHYTIPLSKPCTASTVTITNFGIICRQNANYVHGTGATTYKTPSYTAALTGQDSDGAYTSIKVVCTWSNTTNVVNNAPIAANIRGTFTFT